MVVLLAGLANPAFAQNLAVVTTNEPGWMKVGEITASFKTTNESIIVLGADEFESIKLKVTDAPIEIERLQVFYESGDMEEVRVAHQLKEGGETKAIKLEHPERDIKKVAFTYKTSENYKGERATVELHGLKTPRQGDHNDGLPDGQTTKKTGKEVEDAGEKLDNEREKAAEEAKELKEEARETERDAERNADKAEENAEAAARKTEKDVANVKDKVYAGKRGPQGQTVYIDKTSRYYYITEDEQKVYLSKAELKDSKKD